MYSFPISLAALILGYILYGKFVEKVLGPACYLWIVFGCIFVFIFSCIAFLTWRDADARGIRYYNRGWVSTKQEEKDNEGRKPQK